MVPEAELNTLHADAALAVMLAVEGNVTNGMEILLAGLRRTEELEAEETWAEELSARYRKAINGYSRRFGYGPLLLLDLPKLPCTAAAG